MKVTNMKGQSGKSVPNQFIISGTNEIGRFEVFQSYETVIARKQYNNDDDTYEVTLDVINWDSTPTTSKYRNLFVEMDRDEIIENIRTGKFKLANLG